MRKLLASLLISLIVVAGVYTIAATIATAVAGGLASADETTATEHRTSRAHARDAYRDKIKPAVARSADFDAADVVPDAALYRAHRQLPDALSGCNVSGNPDVIYRLRRPLSHVAMN